ncbi:MAG: UDP-3-O-(3-hydroxymyristoyl)glucosamine N-acyltransferase [bacterium]
MYFRVRDLALMLGGSLEGDAELVILGVAKIEEARAGEITFLANPKYEKYLATTQASVILVSPNQRVTDRTVIRVADPYRAFAQLLPLYYPPENLPELGIHTSACIALSAQIGGGARIGANVVIGEESVLEEEVAIYPNAVLGERVFIGKKTIIHANVSIRSGVRIGRRVVIQNNSVIGSEGFGFAPKAEGDYEKIPQVGTVIIEDDVEIGAGCTIDRATLGATRIEKGTKLDNLIQVAHNVVIGANTVIAAQSGISGSTKIGAGCMIGGQAGFTGHITLGDGSMVGAQSGVSKTYPPGSKISGRPASPHHEELRIQALRKHLPDLAKRISRLETELADLRSKLTGEK